MIYGDVIRLRAIERSDIPTFLRWFNDPQIRRTLLVEGPVSEVAEERWFEQQAASEDRIFGVEIPDGEGWLHVGNVGLIAINWKDRVAEAGIVIGEKDRWGQGFGRDAVRTAARYAFDDLNLHRIELEVFEFNERARRCYTACGFQHEGIRRQALFRNGRYHDIIQMGLLRSELRSA